MKTVATLLCSTLATFSGNIRIMIAKAARHTRPRNPGASRSHNTPHGLGPSPHFPMRGHEAQDCASDRIKIAISFR